VSPDRTGCRARPSSASGSRCQGPITRSIQGPLARVGGAKFDVAGPRNWSICSFGHPLGHASVQLAPCPITGPGAVPQKTPTPHSPHHFASHLTVGGRPPSITSSRCASSLLCFWGYARNAGTLVISRDWPPCVALRPCHQVRWQKKEDPIERRLQNTQQSVTRYQ